MDTQPVRLRVGVSEWRRVDDEIVAVVLADQRFVSVNRSGAPLWEALVAGTDVAHLEALLVEKHRITADRAQADVRAFLDDLRSRGLLEPVQ
ncbi:MAG TPA: PqqD family protein [Mycobacteriales bacterium]|nr:PqqD family protein [Mycobacteriales bacterium]